MPLPYLKFTFQWPISPPSVSKHLSIVIINVALKKWLKTFAAGFFYNFSVGTAYLIALHFFNGNHNQLLFSFISTPFALFRASYQHFIYLYLSIQGILSAALHRFLRLPFKKPG